MAKCQIPSVSHPLHLVKRTAAAGKTVICSPQRASSAPQFQHLQIVVLVRHRGDCRGRRRCRCVFKYRARGDIRGVARRKALRHGHRHAVNNRPTHARWHGRLLAAVAHGDRHTVNEGDAQAGSSLARSRTFVVACEFLVPRFRSLPLSELVFNRDGSAPYATPGRDGRLFGALSKDLGDLIAAAEE